MAEVRGLRWCRSEFRSVPLLTANILCVRHNNALSDVDQEARRFKDRLVMDLSGPRVARKLPTQPRDYFQLNGRLSSRWLTKTFGNFTVADGRPLDVDFARYSFGKPTAKRLHFFLYGRVGQEIVTNANEFRIRTLIEQRGGLMCEVDFYGFTWFVSNFDLHPLNWLGLNDGAGGIATRDLLHQPRAIKYDSATGPRTVNIWWK